MDLFNRKKVSQLESDLSSAEIEISNLRRRLREIEYNYSKLQAQKAPIKTYTIDAVEFAKQLQKYPKRGICGRNGCGYQYTIPATTIDKVVNANA